MVAEDDYILLSDTEKERLQLQARVWQAETEHLLDRIGIQSGWHCLDLGCGAMGILGPLSRRVGTSGKVVGLDIDPKLIEAARVLGEDEGWNNVELQEGDALQTHLAPSHSPRSQTAHRATSIPSEITHPGR